MNYQVYYLRFAGLLKPSEMKHSYLGLTHRLVTQVEATSLDEVFVKMQAEQWSPHGEARALIRGLHLNHTSLSVGDVVQDAHGLCWICERVGWRPLSFLAVRLEAMPPLWLAIEADFSARPPRVTRFNISDREDYLPPDAYLIERFGWTAWADLLTLAKLIEQRLELTVTIEVGDAVYETAAGYQFYVGYVISEGWHQAIISVPANSPHMARHRIEEELKKPGRGQYLARWIEGSRLVKVKPPSKARDNE